MCNVFYCKGVRCSLLARCSLLVSVWRCVAIHFFHCFSLYIGYLSGFWIGALQVHARQEIILIRVIPAEKDFSHAARVL